MTRKLHNKVFFKKKCSESPSIFCNVYVFRFTDLRALSDTFKG